MKTINHESDFKLLVGYSDGSPINEPFRLTFYTKVSRGTFIAEYNGSEYVNCYPDGGMVKIPFDKPMLGMGVLSVKIELFLSDADFKDGKYDYVSVEPTGIILDKGATEPFEDMEVLISKPNTRGLQMFLSKPYLGEGGGGGGGEIPNGSVTEYKLANGAVSTAKIKDGAVTMAKLGSDVKKALEDAEIADGSITEEKLSEEVRKKLNQGGGSGEKGEDGKSAYEIWLEQGNEGSEQDFLDSLKGEKGEQGEQGEKGDDGEKGEKGEKGDKMTYDDLTEAEKDDLASRVEVPAPEIPEEVLSEYAKKSEVPTKTSQLTNDSGYVTTTEVRDAVAIRVINQTDTIVAIQPNVLNVWGEVVDLGISLAEGEDGVVNEYMAQFTSGATATTLTLPNTIKWMTAPNIQPNKTYQLSIINNLGVIGEFSYE